MNRVIALLGIGLLAAGWVKAAQDPAVAATAAEPAVELPKFVVTDSRELPPPESWRYATIPGFEILTNASDRATQRLLRDFGMFRQALGHVWPLPPRNAQITPLIICGRGAKFDAFVPAGKRRVDAAVASLFFKEGNQSAIIIDLEATTLNVLNTDPGLDAVFGTDSGTVSVEHDKQLYREYVRYLLSASEPRSPPWFEEGLSQIIMKMQWDRRWIEFAKLEDPNTISTQAAMNMAINASLPADENGAPGLPGAPVEDRDFPTALRRRSLIPLGEFFAVQRDAPEAVNSLGNNVWCKQAYAFVHMCLYGYKGKYQKAFTQFLQRSMREPVTEEMFKECFRFPGRNGTFKEMSYKDMLMEIRSYCDMTVYEAKLFKAKEDVILTPKPLELRDATPPEIGRIKGETLMIAGHIAKAKAELIAPYVRGERDPYLLASLGMYERKHGEPDRARKFLEAAYTGKAKNPEAMVELARIRHAEAIAKPGAAEQRLTPAQVASIIDPLVLVRRMPPHLYGLYDLMADTWIRSESKPKRDDIVPVIEGAQLFPTRLKLVYQAAVLAAEVQELQAAHALADHGIRHGPDAAVKKRFEDLKATLPPAPPPAPAPAATPPPAPPGASTPNPVPAGK